MSERRGTPGGARGTSAAFGRLRKLAASGSTGILPFAGLSDGAIHLVDGTVAWAESSRTPPPRPGPPGPGTAALLAAEPVVDAALDLLADGTACTRFRADRGHAAARYAIGVPELLAEVDRRRRVLSQLAPVLTPDTALQPSPRIAAPGVAVSALQWALLIRVRHAATPRALAFDLGASVFGTTAEAWRLLCLGLLMAPSQPDSLRRAPPALSFIRAVSADRPAGPAKNRAAPADNPAAPADEGAQAMSHGGRGRWRYRSGG